MENKVLAKMVLACAVLVLAVMTAFGQDEKVEWEESFAAAMAKAKETGKHVFADFTSEVN